MSEGQEKIEKTENQEGQEKTERAESQGKLEQTERVETHEQKEVIQIEEESEGEESRTKTGLVYSRKRLKRAESKEDMGEIMPPKQKFKTVAIFGDARLGKDQEFLKASFELGRELARRGATVVYAGGIGGLRGNAAVAASVNGSNVVSVLVRGLDDRQCTMGSELRTASLPERMGCTLYYSEAFIALPGGMETLEGIASIAHWATLNFHRKPLGLLNVNGFYDGLLFFLDQAVEQGFMHKGFRKTILSAPTASQLLDQMQDYEPEIGYLMRPTGWRSPASNGIPRPPPVKNEQGLDTSLRL